jgi:hypothetical protein
LLSSSVLPTASTPPELCKILLFIYIKSFLENIIIGPLCTNIYIYIYKQLQKLGASKYRHGFELTFHSEMIDYPVKLKQAKMIFVNSLSDLFHEKYLSISAPKHLIL